MFSRKKEPTKERRARPPGSLAQYGIFEIPENIGDIGNMNDDDDDDEDLEAELAALTAGNASKKPASRRAPPKPPVDLDKMIQESMKDIGSDEELSGDDEDPDLLNELKAITGDAEEEEKEPSIHDDDAVNETTKLLDERLSMYKTAEIKAKSENESSKARRYNRGVKTLEQLLASSRHGQKIDSSDIPPALPPSAFSDSTKKNLSDEKPTVPEAKSDSPEENSPPLVEQASSEPEGQISPLPESKPEESVSAKANEETINMLKYRQKEFKIAALAWKKSGNQEEAVKYLKIAKQFDAVIAAIAEGNTIDLSDMPPSPALPSCTTAPSSSHEEKKVENVNQQDADMSNLPESTAPPAPNTTSLDGALKERLEVYRRSKTVAESEGNSSKARRYGRICKQFEDAIKLHTKGKPIPIDELPTPPGFPPLSEIGKTQTTPPKPASSSLPGPSETAEDSVSAVAPSRPAPKQPVTNDSNTTPAKEVAPVAPPRTNSDKKKKLTSRVDKQIEILQKRQKELKMAALKAKKDGDLDLARDYLRQAKGIDPLLAASAGGLPVDLKSIPLSPEAKLELEDQDTNPNKVNDDGFTMISSMDCTEASGSDQEIYENLEAQLIKQIKWCLSTRDHCKALADVTSYNRWERLALDYKKDLDLVRTRKRSNLPPPQHHYEIKTHSIVQSCTDLTDADIEISIIRGVNYTKEVDTYVIFELPWPSDSPSTDRTSTIRDNNSPEYNAVFPLSGIIDRKSRQCLRVFKRHALKCQVWSKGCSLNPILMCTHPRGFFRADSLVGTVNIKLQELETKCILHDSFPLMDGRKTVGGKLEVKIRLRNPILTKQIEQNTDKWLSIDN